MAKVKLLPEQIEVYKMDEEGKAYLEYNDVVGGEPFGYSFDGLSLVGKFGTITDLYKECIKQKKTWDEVLKEPNMTTIEDVDNALEKYNIKFKSGFPSFQLMMYKSYKEIVEIVDRCIKEKKDVYELGYLQDEEITLTKVMYQEMFNEEFPKTLDSKSIKDIKRILNRCIRENKSVYELGYISRELSNYDA